MAPGFGGLSPKLADAIMSHSGPVAQQDIMVTGGQGHGQHSFCYILLSHPPLAQGTSIFTPNLAQLFTWSFSPSRFQHTCLFCPECLSN